MKKLMMALAVVVCATAVQASTYNWKSAKGALYTAGGKALVTSGTAYLFDANKYSQSALVDALFVDKTYASVDAAFAAKGIAGSANANIQTTGKINASSDFTYTGEPSGTEWNAYFVIVNGDNVFISDSTATQGTDLQSATTISMAKPTTASQASALDGADGWSGAGWYTESVPEPTSGLLLLLGMAGLALRRRRA